MSEPMPEIALAGNAPAAETAPNQNGADAGLGKDLAFSERGFLFDPATGQTYTLNRTGAFVFQKLRQGVPVADVAASLSAEFEVDRERAGSDVRDFLQQLRDFGLS